MRVYWAIFKTFYELKSTKAPNYVQGCGVALPDVGVQEQLPFFLLKIGTSWTHCIWLHSLTSWSTDFPPKTGKGRLVTGEPRRTVSLSALLYFFPLRPSPTCCSVASRPGRTGRSRSVCEHGRWKRRLSRVVEGTYCFCNRKSKNQMLQPGEAPKRPA